MITTPSGDVITTMLLPISINSANSRNESTGCAPAVTETASASTVTPMAISCLIKRPSLGHHVSRL